MQKETVRTDKQDVTSMRRVQRLAECAVLLAIGTVLMTVKLFEMPSGGAVTLAYALPFIIISLRHGMRWGLLSGLACALLQMITGFWVPPAASILAFVGVVLLDYVIAFTLNGAACVFAKPFRNRGLGIAVAAAAVCAIRFLCSFLSGFLIWGSITQNGLSAVVYSLTYNGSYMAVETVITVLMALVLFRMAPKLFEEQR